MCVGGRVFDGVDLVCVICVGFVFLFEDCCLEGIFLKLLVCENIVVCVLLCIVWFGFIFVCK